MTAREIDKELETPINRNGISLREIAEINGISMQRAKQILDGALEKMRLRLLGKGLKREDLL